MQLLELNSNNCNNCNIRIIAKSGTSKCCNYWSRIPMVPIFLQLRETSSKYTTIRISLQQLTQSWNQPERHIAYDLPSYAPPPPPPPPMVMGQRSTPPSLWLWSCGWVVVGQHGTRTIYIYIVEVRTCMGVSLFRLGKFYASSRISIPASLARASKLDAPT